MTTNPFSASAGINGLIQRQFGGAWPKVQDVYNHLTELEYISDNMDAVRAAANNITRGILVIEEATPALGATAYVDWPTGVDINDLLNYSVIAIGSDGTVYTADSGHFTFSIVGAALEFVLDAGAPATLATTGTIRWTIDYKN